MNKYAEEQANALLQAVSQSLGEAGFTCRPQRYEGSATEYQVLSVTDPNGEEDVAIDTRAIVINEKEYILLQYKCVLIANIEEELLAELKTWLEQANILMPLGSLVLVGNLLLMRYSLLCPTARLPERDMLDAATELFFMQRILYADIGVDLLVGENTLEEALSRLRQEQVNI